MDIFDKWKKGEASIICSSEEECIQFVKYVYDAGIEYIGKEGANVTFWKCNEGEKQRGYNCSMMCDGVNHMTTFSLPKLPHTSMSKHHNPLSEVFDFQDFAAEQWPSIDDKAFEAFLLE